MAKLWKTTARLRRRRPRQEGELIAYYEAVSVPLEIDIDWEGLARVLGQKAFDNGSGRSRFLNGLITVRALKTKAEKI